MVLGLGEGADDEAVKSAYRSLIKLYHPDVRPDEASGRQYRAVCDAYEYLCTNRASQAVWAAAAGASHAGHRVFGTNEDIGMMRARMSARADYARQDTRSSSPKKSRADEFIEKAREAKQERLYNEAMDRIHTERAAEVMAQIIEAYLASGNK